MKTVIYSRVSTEEQGREGVSLANQIEKCRLQAQIGEWEIVAEIQDSGKSAKSLNRPGIQEILEMGKRKEVQSIIIYKLDRLTRNVSDLNRLIETFTKQGVSLISVKDSLDTHSAAGRMVINILGTISQWEREVIAERTSEALQYKRGESKKYTRITPYGFSLVGDSYESNEEEQKAVALIIRLRDALEYSYQEIADHLNGEQIPTRFGKPWIRQTVQKVYLANELKLPPISI